MNKCILIISWSFGPFFFLVQGREKTTASDEAAVWGKCAVNKFGGRRIYPSDGYKHQWKTDAQYCSNSLTPDSS